MTRPSASRSADGAVAPAVPSKHNRRPPPAAMRQIVTAVGGKRPVQFCANGDVIVGPEASAEPATELEKWKAGRGR